MDERIIEETVAAREPYAVLKPSRYIETVGRRKTAVARVRFMFGSRSSFLVNGRTLEEYFRNPELVRISRDPLSKTKVLSKLKIDVRLHGGGIHAQAEAIRHGISRGLVLIDPEVRKKLKKLGFIKRDPRMKERRKFGLKKARKAPQWSKR